VREADQLIAGALRDIAAEAGLPRPVADAAWRAGRRRRLATVAASAASVAGAIALALAVVLPLAAAPGPASPPVPSARLVSITLSPTTPARADVLAAAAQILRQRATQLHLPSIQAQVLGPNVVLTGPSADEAQLKTLAQGGVLNFRQVLLYQPDGAAAGVSTYGDASLVNHNTLALFSKLVCRPANTSTWKGQVGYSVAGDYDNPNTQIVSCDSSGGKYALDLAKVQDTQISNATAELSTTSNQQQVMLTLNRAGASALGTLTSHLFSKYSSGAAAGNDDDLWLDTVAFVLDGNVVSAPHIEDAIPGGKLPVTGNFTRAQAEDLATQLQSGPLPVDFRISAISTSAPSASSQAAAG
jgi:preprotein translocase subunit SecD